MEWLTTFKMKKNETMMKHMHNQLFMARKSMKHEDVVLALMQNMPPF